MRPISLAVLASVTFSASGSSETARYGYDALGRVVTVDRRASAPNSALSFYTYDAAGNRSRLTTSGPLNSVTLAPNSSLALGQGVMSPDARFVLLFRPDGNLVLLDQNGTTLWAAGTAGSGATYVVMQGDGNLVVYSPTGAVWSSVTYGNAGAFLAVQSDGNVVIYGSQGPLWNTGTCCR